MTDLQFFFFEACFRDIELSFEINILPRNCFWFWKGAEPSHHPHHKPVVSFCSSPKSDPAFFLAPHPLAAQFSNNLSHISFFFFQFLRDSDAGRPSAFAIWPAPFFFFRHLKKQRRSGLSRLPQATLLGEFPFFKPFSLSFSKRPYYTSRIDQSSRQQSFFFFQYYPTGEPTLPLTFQK